MKAKTYPILIWFLSVDPYEAVQFLNDEHVVKSIKTCIQSVLSIYFYQNGIRSKKFYNHYFSKENCQDSLDKFFPAWSVGRCPSFSNYDSRISKWCRKCNEHYQYMLQYLNALCNEHQFRFKKSHYMEKVKDWLNEFPINVPSANLKKMDFEWKCLPPKFRNKDVIKGYRDYYKEKLQNDGIQINDFTNRNIPDFLLDKEINKFML